jgi:hypothetical protein
VELAGENALITSLITDISVDSHKESRTLSGITLPGALQQEEFQMFLKLGSDYLYPRFA